MRRFRRWPLSRRSAPVRCVPQLEALEDRTLPAAVTLFGQFQNSLGLLSLQGDSASHLVTESLSSSGFVQVSVGNQVASSDPHSAAYDPALAGATGQTLKAIQLNGSAGLDDLVLGNLNVAGGLSVQTDGVLDVQGNVAAAGPIQLSGQSVLLAGQVRADGPIGGAITVTAGNVLQSGLLEANGSQGNGGAIHVDFTGHYVATASSLTSASSTGAGSGGLVVIDGAGTGTLFSSGQIQASDFHGGQGGEINLFGQQVHLVGATINASGWSGGGWVRVGGDSPSDIAAHGGNSAGVSYASTTTVDATTTLTADALGAGNGGRIVVWSQQTTTFAGTLDALGAGSQAVGGLIEVSSAGLLTYGGHANATAASGKPGRLLLDPANLTIQNNAGLPTFNLANPDPDLNGTDSFGNNIVQLSNGNFVLTDPNSSLVTAYAGAVYVFDGQTGALIGTLTGSTSYDEVGSGGVTALSNGNFVVSSPSWQDNGNSVGAATWVDGSGGPVEAVSEANSLFGSTSGDEVGYAVTALRTNGNYVVSSPYWQSAGAQVGAVTWGNGASGTSGAVGAANSLVGSTNGDDVGNDGVTALTNGNYVVDSGSWVNPNGSNGAATWGSGAGGASDIGTVSAANSLVGGVSSGQVGGSVTALSDGNYVVGSSGWNVDNTASGLAVGAATWGNGATGTIGVVSASNSLIGATGFDNVSEGGVTALSNGNYAVISPYWQQNGGYVGAVTWGQAGGGTVGQVTAANSLVGSTDGDNVGVGGVTLLSNGDYVVNSPNWQSAGNDVGAVTWAADDGSTVGPVTTSNSLVGATNGDQVGSGGVTALANGAYVVSSPDWQSGANVVVGAATWAAADGSTVGNINIGNSLVGSTNGDEVGSGGVTALPSGNYVVNSPGWQKGANVVGAVTLSQADGSTLGPVTAGNSFVGATNGDQVGSGGVTVLSSGDFLISSPSWQQGGVNLGAVTWINGITGLTLDPSSSNFDSANSLIGPGAGALLAQVVGLSNGGSFLAGFTGHGGSVILTQIAAQSEYYATAPTATVTLAPSFITATLDAGTAVVLQASNDITVYSPIVVNNPSGRGGDLTLDAGRQILIYADITTDNGDLTLLANDTAADGVVSSERGLGTAALSMFAGTTINTGTGNVTIEEDTGAGNANYASDDITAGDIIAHNVTLLNYGLGDTSIGGVSPGGGADMASVTASGNLTVYSTFDISQYGALSQPGDNVINVAGATSLTAAGSTGGEILLNNPANIFGGPVTYNDPGQDVTIEASGNLTLSSSTTAATLTAYASGILASTGPLATSGASVQDQGGSLTSGDSSLTGGTITLTDPQNSFKGLIGLTSPGAITVTNAVPLTIGSATISGGDVTLTGPTTLTAPSISFIGDLNVGAQTLTLNSTTPVDLNSDTTIAGGTITDSSGLVIGSGATLSGAGKLQVGAGAAGVLVQATGTLAPGLNPTGLTVNGDLAFASGAILSEQVQGSTQYGLLKANGAINLGNATLSVAFVNPYHPAAYDQFQFLDNGPGNSITGTFAQGSTFNQGANTLTVNYASGASNNVLLITQGAPAVVSALPPYSQASFNVSWSGQEYAQGASAFDVYVSKDSGPFTLWQSNTTQSSATYAGQGGHFYSFFAVYTDDAALETPASQASTTTKITPTIVWTNPGDITYGTALSATQLDAQAETGNVGFSTTVPGTYVYTPAAGTTLSVGQGQTLDVTFTPLNANVYTTAQGSVVINVDGATPTFSNLSSPTISFGTLSTVVSGDLNANAGAPLVPAGETVQITINGVSQSVPLGADDSFSATFTTNTLGVAGSAYPISFSYAGDANFSSATGSGSLTVNPVSQSINFNPTSPVVFSDPMVLLASGGGSGNAVTFSVVSGPGTINGNTLDFTGTGSVVVQADQAGSANYTAAPSVQRTIVVGTSFTTPASENENGTPTAVTVTSALGGNYSDPDGTAYTKPGIAVFQMDGTGTWQYSANGTTWITIASVSQAQSLLLPAADKLRFVPATNFSGQANLYFVAWDGSQGTAGSFTSIAVNGGTTPFSIDAGALAVTVKPVPQWVGAGAALTSLLPGTFLNTNPTTPAGNTIASVFGAYFQDNNPNVTVGVAINSVTGLTSGTWQFMTSGSSTWTNFPTVSATAALLLSANDQIRFVPKTNFVGTVSLKALAWDGSVGIDGKNPNPATLGSSVVSTATLTATASANHAPTLTTSSFTQASVAQYATSAAATVASLLIKAGYADQDGKGLPQGIAITGTVLNSGTFQYMLAGGTWKTLPSVSSATAFLLPSTASLRFVAGNSLVSPTLTFQGWDQTQGVAGQTYNITSPGNASAFSTAQAQLSYTVTTSTNHSPTLANQSFPEPAVIVTTTGAAITVTSLLTQAGYADQDSKALHGIALFGVTGGVGVAQYQLAPLGPWQTVPSVSALSALLLPSTASLRLVAGDQTGTETLSFFGWDQTQGVAGQLFSIANLGGASAFSQSPAAATILVANHAPTLTTLSTTLPAINENANSPAVTAATLATKAGYADANGKTLPSGIAITGDSGPGTWQWLDGTIWTAVPSVSTTSAFLLPSATQLRFQPDDSLATNTNSSATLTYLGWNETVGAADTSFTLPSAGGASAFSTNSATASMPVNFVKPTPVWLAGSTAKFSPVLGFQASNATQPTGDTVGSVFASAFRDAPGINVGVAISAQTGTAFGGWQYSTNGGQTWVSFPATVSASAALLLTAADRIRFVPTKAFSGTVSLTAYAWDGTGGFTTDIANVTKAGTGVGHPFSPTTLAASCLVNNAPKLA